MSKKNLSILGEQFHDFQLVYRAVQPVPPFKFVTFPAPPKGPFPLPASSQPPFSHLALDNTHLLPVFVDCLLWPFHVNGVIQKCGLFLRFIHAIACMSISFSLLNSVPMHFELESKHITATWKPDIVVVSQLPSPSGISQYLHQATRGY